MPPMDRDRLLELYFSDEDLVVIDDDNDDNDTIIVNTNPQPPQQPLKLPLRPSSNSKQVSIDVGDDVDVDTEYDFLWDNFDLQSYDKNDEQDHKELKLIAFRIYKKNGDPSRPESLHNVCNHDPTKQPMYCFDGKLVQENGSTTTLKGIDIYKVSIGNLRDVQDGTAPESAKTPIWLATKTSMKYDCWYILGPPESSYRATFEPLIWLAQFAKHLIDYLAWSSSKQQTVGLVNLKNDFLAQLVEWHKDDSTFRKWHAACGHTSDFRRHLACATHASFIYSQAYDIGDEDDDAVLSHLLWSEIGQPVETRRENEKPGLRRTTVTPHVANCFLQTFPEWGKTKWNLLKMTVVGPVLEAWHGERRKSLGLGHTIHGVDSKSSLNVSSILETATLKKAPLGKNKQSVTAGKAVLIAVCDGCHDCASWPCHKAEYRFGYVQKVDRAQLHVSWLLTPTRTACVGRYAGRDPHKKAFAFYPITNELFWDGDGIEQVVSTHNVVAVYNISLNSSYSRPGDELFVHRAYHHSDCSFRTTCPIRVAEQPKVGNSRSKLNLLSLFSASGLLDLGIEHGSGGLLETIFAADLNGEALKTFQANHPKPSVCHFHHDDVNKLLHQYCFSTNTAQLPNVDCLIAGCPCQGFSNLNSKKDNERSQKNCSLLAHTLSWVEVLLPRMVVIENVPPMDACSADKKAPPTAAGQAVCHLLSLGYQAKVITIRSSDYGGATDRNRIFIIASIPQIPLPDIPAPTHGNSVEQYTVATAKGATTDLEVIDNDTELNIIHPDHVPFQRLNQFEKDIVELVPRKIRPGKRMANLLDAVPYMSRVQRQWFNGLTDEQRGSGGNSLRRIHPDRPMQTITTRLALLDSRSVPRIHWSSDRMVSLLELRRGQGVPEHYIMIGDRISQLKQIGNSVAWSTSTVLGKAIAAVWRKAFPERFPSTRTSLTEGLDMNLPSTPVLKKKINRIKHKLEAGARIDDLSDSEDELEKEPDFVDMTSSDWQTNSTPMSSLSSSRFSTPLRSRLPSTGITALLPQVTVNVPGLPPTTTPARSKLLPKSVTRSAPAKSTTISREVEKYERLSIRPGGSTLMKRKFTSKTTIQRKRFPSSDDDDDDEDDEDSDTIVVKQPRLTNSIIRPSLKLNKSVKTLLSDDDDDSEEDIFRPRRRLDLRSDKPLVNIPKLSRSEALRRSAGKSQSLDFGFGGIKDDTSIRWDEDAGKTVETAIEIVD